MTYLVRKIELTQPLEIQLNHRNTVQSAAVLMLLVAFTTSASAQIATDGGGSTALPADRARVKGEAREAEKANTLQHGDLPMPASNSNTGTPTDRAKMKSDTAAFNKSKQAPYAPSGSYSQANGTKSLANRADVKADARAAEKDQTIPRGQAQPTKSAE